MKKLMFAFSAVAIAAVASADVSSSNIVGYLGDESTDPAPSKSFGACFFQLGGGDTYKLGNITVVSDDPENPFDPDAEFIQILDPLTTFVSASYTCLTQQAADFQRDIMEDEDMATLIEENLGWWDFEFGATLSNIQAGSGVNRDNEEIDVGQGFLCSMTDAAKRKFTSSGEVPQIGYGLEYTAPSQFFANYLPVGIPLGRITVVSGDDENPFDPDAEFIQVLDPMTTFVEASYTCLTQQAADFQRDVMEDEDMATLIENNLGWWDFEFGATLSNIQTGSAVKRDSRMVAPGEAFLCSMTDAASRTFNFPPAIENEGK